MQMLTCIQVLFIATTTTMYAILDLILLNADTYVSTYVSFFLFLTLLTVYATLASCSILGGVSIVVVIILPIPSFEKNTIVDDLI